MGLGPAAATRGIDPLERQHRMQAAVRGRMQVRELPPDQESPGGTTGEATIEHGRARTRHGDGAGFLTNPFEGKQHTRDAITQRGIGGLLV
jgi:hypothetical protein